MSEEITPLAVPLNNLDRFVLCGGDKASASAVEVLGFVEKMIAGTNAQFRKQVDAPTGADSAGNPGEWAINSTHLFFCTSTDNWIRIALAAW